MIKGDIIENYNTAVKKVKKENGISIEFSEHQIKHVLEFLFEIIEAQTVEYALKVLNLKE